MTEKILNILKNNKEFTSGEKIAKSLNITRAAVWKNIVKLKSMGYNITSVTNKGYLLIEDSDIFNNIEIEKEINTFKLGKKIYYFDEINSTNEYAKKIINESIEEGTLIVANSQTNGKGRLDRQWISNKGDGIFLSLILRPDIELFKITQITLLAGICICNTIKNITGLDVKIKWPNDIIIDNKKVCGILTEINAQIDRVSYVILGIGINVNNEKFNVALEDKATSIFLQLGKNINRQKVIAHFLKEFENNYFKYIKEKNFATFLDEYKKLCINLGKECKIVSSKKEIVGKVIDISPLGEIIFKTKDEILKIVSGEVSLRNIDGSYI
ncbi:biotin--[acetyl-CoA-carboxylase] ligase [uncultured Tyzzerella sp.]|uniref:biotin--[acetyl-CoA-carboxylase] ligase n=1 Tax=uncultured Tyzzerella sp. TaxID=2321398 RepID=UPI00294215FA|nr:biotin--[acetyl-CoA-carboxylase] ligase [uncultured Tyzzerella sp.]